MDQPTPDEPRICPQCGTANTPDAAAANAYCCIQCGLELAHVDTMPTGGVRGMFGWLKQAGDVVGDRYVVRGVLGKGGFGATYLADDRRVQGKRWALKEIPELLFDEHEVALLGKLDHPAIPAIGDCFAENGMKYLALKFGGSRTLRHECRANGRIPYHTLKPWAVQLAQALQYLHGQVPPVVHRDLKPDNVLLDENDRVMLIDFGIAKQALPDTKTRTTGRAISHGFSAPEQIMNTGTDARSDVYAYAATLYYALTGLTPPSAIERVTGGSLASVDQWAPDLPAPVGAALQRAMSLNPNERQQRIGEMLEVLDDGSPSPQLRLTPAHNPGQPAGTTIAPFSTDKTVLLPRMPAAPAPQPPVWRRAGLVVLGLALLVSGGYWGSQGWNGSAGQPPESEENEAVSESRPAVVPEDKAVVAEKDAVVMPGGLQEPEMIIIPGRSSSISKYGVTRGQYAAFVSATGGSISNDCYLWNGSIMEQRGNWRSPGFSQGDDEPVVCVSWHDAVAYAEWLSARTGKRFRLPMENEWYTPCREGGPKEYCGSNDTELVAWYAGNSGKRTHPVGQKRPNGHGHYDMSDNVWEWTGSCFDKGCSRRAIRGGSQGFPPSPGGVGFNFNLLPVFLPSTERDWSFPDYRGDDLGFRLAQD